MTTTDFSAFTTKQILDEVSRRMVESKESVRLGLLEKAKKTIAEGYDALTSKGDIVHVTDLPPNMLLALNKLVNDAPEAAFVGDRKERLRQRQEEMQAREVDVTKLDAGMEPDPATGE